ncbi:MAG: uroporphyrinogen decarboxylase [Pseudomonadota bacterium]
MKTHRFLQALQRKITDRTPIWLMRQAGRYLPEYRKLRQQAGSFMTLCQTPELACEVSLQPLRRFDLDAVILFSDILTIPDAMGLGLQFIEGQGPVFNRAIRTAADVSQLSVVDPYEKLRYVSDAAALVKKSLHNEKPLIGFSGSPWTLATYMVEGKSNRSFSTIKAMMAEQPQTLHRLLEILTRSVIDYLNAQIEAGVDAVMVFDTWGSILVPDHFMSYSLQYMQQIIAGLKKTRSTGEEKIPSILFTRESGPCLEAMADSGCSALGVDWTVDIGDARKRVGHQVALQGNLKPEILKESPETIRAAVKAILRAFGPHPGHVFNLGHGVTPDIPPENVKILIDSVHEFSQSD